MLILPAAVRERKKVAPYARTEIVLLYLNNALSKARVLHWGLRIMADAYKCFYEKKADGFIQFICFLVGDFVNELVLPLEVWPCSCSYDENYVDLVDAQSVVHVVKMNRDLEPSVWSFNGYKWIEFMSSFEVLDPKIIHFDQINRNRFLVNFYTKDGDEVDYGRTKDHCDKCLVLGCHDPRMYQPIPHKMLLNTKRFRLWVLRLRVLNGKECCESEMFSATKVIVISSDEYGGSFDGKVIHGFVSDTNVVANNICGPGESSNLAAVSEKSFVIEFNSCAERKGYLSIPASFHCHLIRGGYRVVWLNGNGRSLYMCMKIHIDKRCRREKNSRVHLVGEMHRLKEVLELIVGDRMVFELVSGNISSDEPLFFSVMKLNGSF
ncbi:hypothetical protein Tco_0455027, partial [Tanacetum coccineum]